MKAEKQFLLDEIKEKLDASKAFVLTNYKGFDANNNAEFRSALIKTGGDFEVVKKRIFLKAAEQAGITVNQNDLEGHLAVVFAKEDPITTTKAVFKFSKDHKEMLSVIGGHFDGKYASKDEVTQISELPSMNEMRAQFVGLLQAPMSQTLGVMNALMTSVMHCLEQKAKKEESNQ
ncbi:MAG: 50S ribosomal protein L10 [Chlamydiales bacterium]|nr:50S ribosomal protein L10 [Chlamydiales bacterium]